MMGHRGKLKSAAEYDALTRWRKVLYWKPGETKQIKRKYNKRQRYQSRFELKRSTDQSHPTLTGF